MTSTSKNQTISINSLEKICPTLYYCLNDVFEFLKEESDEKNETNN